MPTAIADSSTLIHLAGIDKLDLLKRFHKGITIPSAVWREVVEQGKNRPGSEAVKRARQAGWIEVVTPNNQDLVKALGQELDQGEAETIALAVERQAEIVFLDESEARHVAGLYNLEVTGAIGVLIRAKRAECIPSLKPELDRLQAETGFWIHPRLYREALRAVDETP